MSSAPIKILFLIDYFHRTGGTEKHLVQLIAGLPAEQFRCSVVAFDMGRNLLLEELRARGVAVIHLPVGREYVPNGMRQAVRLWRLMRRERYDIVQTYHQKADSYGALLARLAGVPVLISSKRDTGELRNPLHVFVNRRLRGLFDAFIMVAEGVREAVARRDGLPATRVCTIYNGVDTGRFTPADAARKAAARRALGIPDTDLVVGMVAGFRPEKNHEVFFEAMERVALQVPNLRVVPVGGGPLLEQYRHSVAASPLATRTTFTGDVTDVLPVLHALDIGCLTSGSNEGFSNALIEQMAVGLPLVVTEVGGNAEAVVDGVTGFVVRPHDAAAVAGATLRLATDPVLRADRASAARTRAEDRFSLERMWREHAALYLRLAHPHA